MRIVFIVQYHFFGGTFFRWHNLARALQQQGHTVTVFSASGNPAFNNTEELIDGIPYHIISGNKGARFFGNASSNPITAIRRLMVPYPQADVYHLFQPFLSGALSWRYLQWKYPKAAFVYDWDDLWVGGLMQKEKSVAWDYFWVHQLEKKLPPKADAVTVCSAYLEQKAKERGARQIKLLPNGIWPLSAKSDKTAVRALLGLQADAFYLGFMGKTQQELDWCFEVLRQSNSKDIRLALCGIDGSSLSQLPDHLLRRIDFLGQLSPEQATYFAQALNIGLLPLADNAFNQSRFPIKFAEYQKAGTPVAYSPVGSLAAYEHTLPWNINCGQGKTAFVSKLVAYIDSHRSVLQVEEGPLLQQLGWTNIGRDLANFYQNILSACR
jgi:hypothetical protein